MATTKKRINISVSKDLDRILQKLAKRDQVPQATKAEHLIRMAVELEEEEALYEIMHRRDKKGARFTSHKNTWR